MTPCSVPVKYGGCSITPKDRYAILARQSFGLKMTLRSCHPFPNDVAMILMGMVTAEVIEGSQDAGSMLSSCLSYPFPAPLLGADVQVDTQKSGLSKGPQPMGRGCCWASPC